MPKAKNDAEVPVNAQWLSIGRGRQSDELRILRDRYELATRSNPLGMTGLPDPMHAERLRAAEQIAQEIERIESLSDREVVERYVPEARPRPEPVAIEDTLARGRMVGPADFYAPPTQHMPGDFNIGAR